MSIFRMGRGNEMAEGAGFEPAVRYKRTLDFESSAFNRAQPPFRAAAP